MKLRMLVAAAGCIMVPALLTAQTPTDTTKKDTMVKDTMVAPAPAPVPTPEPMPAPPTPEPMPAAPTPTPTPTASTSAAVKDSTPGPRPTPPSDGKTCPWGCPTSGGAAGLSGIQFLALQQELRDRKCGNNHVTGRLDAATRTAIRNCARKLSVANNARAVLIALDIGFSESDIPAAGGNGRE